jgi:hypothetical protein
MKVLTALIAATSLLAVPAQADGFCTALKSVVADAAGNFETIRGAPDEADATQFLHPVSLPNVTPYYAPDAPCRVSRAKSVFSYVCKFPGATAGTEAHDELVAFAHRVKSCLGMTDPGFDFSAPSDLKPGAGSNRGPLSLTTVGAEITMLFTVPPGSGAGTLSIDIEKPHA